MLRRVCLRGKVAVTSRRSADARWAPSRTCPVTQSLPTIPIELSTSTVCRQLGLDTCRGLQAEQDSAHNRTCFQSASSFRHPIESTRSSMCTQQNSSLLIPFAVFPCPSYLPPSHFPWPSRLRAIRAPYAANGVLSMAPTRLAARSCRADDENEPPRITRVS